MNQESGAATHKPLAPTSPTRFSRLFPTTRRGAHTARHAAERWLTDKLTADQPACDDLLATAPLLIAELTANAALHGQVHGRTARLVVMLDATTLRIEVSDARADRLPLRCPDTGGESERGLLLVEALAAEWGVRPYSPDGKTVWATCHR
ncbi:ATP-binding protein [Streptomyces sp. NPDC051320]|uniref:ATP-binding protein n=1 Tax=Streptomyces sp. NPDC051320 TaxID=3154644 RepID=UPI00342A8FCC